jgi:hypothetical protein
MARRAAPTRTPQRRLTQACVGGAVDAADAEEASTRSIACFSARCSAGSCSRAATSSHDVTKGRAAGAGARGIDGAEGAGGTEAGALAGDDATEVGAEDASDRARTFTACSNRIMTGPTSGK